MRLGHEDVALQFGIFFDHLDLLFDGNAEDPVNFLHADGAEGKNVFVERESVPVAVLFQRRAHEGFLFGIA